MYIFIMTLFLSWHLLHILTLYLSWHTSHILSLCVFIHIDIMSILIFIAYSEFPCVNLSWHYVYLDIHCRFRSCIYWFIVSLFLSWHLLHYFVIIFILTSIAHLDIIFILTSIAYFELVCVYSYWHYVYLDIHCIFWIPICKFILTLSLSWHPLQI